MKNTQHKLRYFIFTLLTCVGISFQQTAIASDEIEKSGDAILILIPTITYGTTFYLEDSEGRSQFYKSFLTNLGVTYGLKKTIDKKRPDGSDESFPSGHASVSFQGASFVHRRYGLKYAAPAYISASFVGYSRVESNNHYTEDVIAGAVIGVISSFCFTNPYKGFMITMTANNGFYGLSLNKNW